MQSFRIAPPPDSIRNSPALLKALAMLALRPDGDQYRSGAFLVNCAEIMEKFTSIVKVLAEAGAYVEWYVERELNKRGLSHLANIIRKVSHDVNERRSQEQADEIAPSLCKPAVIAFWSGKVEFET